MNLLNLISKPTPIDRVLSLQGKTAIVTGGNRGLGEAIVRRLAEAGAIVILTGRGEEANKKVESELTNLGTTAVVAIQADASSLEDSQKVIDLAIERFGGVDILVNNAAVFQPRISLEVNEKLWDETQAVDLKGAFFMAQLAAKAMIKRNKGGRIINLLSIDSFRPSGVFSAYDAAKAGLWAVTKSLAKELAEHHILVNAVAPGATITPERITAMMKGEFFDSLMPPEAAETRKKMEERMKSGGMKEMLAKLPLGRPGLPDEIAKAVLFLASDMSSYVSGVCLTVDGAQSL